MEGTGGWQAGAMTTSSSTAPSSASGSALSLAEAVVRRRNFAII
jgi:hypothetical protein